MNSNDYAKIGKLVAGGALVVLGLGRRSLFGMLLMGVGGLVLHRTLRQKGGENSGEFAPETEEAILQKVSPPEITVVHEADLDSISEADTLDNLTEQPAQKP